MKILISGGHLTPALALIDHIQAQYSDWQVVFVGRKYSQTIAKQPSKEQAETNKRNVPFISFDSGKSTSQSLLGKAIQPWLISRAFFRALGIMLTQRPSIYVSFGGYLAPPLALAAWLTGVPIITHEQTRTIGKATTFVGKLARKIAFSHPIKNHPFPKHKITITGNPIRPTLTAPTSTPPAWLSPHHKKPYLYITGGSQGSQVINTTVAQILPRLTREYVVIHQCGSPSTMHYKEMLTQEKKNLPVNAQHRYYIHEWMSEADLNWIYDHARLVISRAGANTVMELQYKQVPAILIPLPFSHADEQLKNATSIAKLGGAKIIEQRKLSPDLLYETVQAVGKNHQSMRRKLATKSMQKHLDAAGNLCQLIEDTASSN